MIDRWGRSIDYLRISVTDRCDLRCLYCRPGAPAPPLPRRSLLSFEEIAAVVRSAVRRGAAKVRLTGGEPLVRRGLETLVAMLAAVPGLRDLSMTTNGTTLAARAEALAEAGLRRVNVSLDALDPERYAAVTRGGDVRRVLAGVAAAQACGLSPVKLNCVVAESSQEPDARAVAEFARGRGLEIRFIRRMDLAHGHFARVEGGEGGNCPRCNRLRLTCDGFIRPCLFSDQSFSVRELGVEAALDRALAHKPRAGSSCTGRSMHAIGG
ncbi:MAG: radical SAM protein [Elusimicrobia bacterium]|nr:radical SAM protein [Elusimicrobiota bacterium]